MSTASGRRIALVAMAAALAAYLAMHSPLRDPIGDVVGLERPTCYFCSPSLTGFDFSLPSLRGSGFPDSLAAAALILLAAFAGWAVSARFPWPAYERLLVFGLATVALVAVPAAAIGALASLFGGTYLRPPAGPLLASIPALALAAASLARGWRPAMPSRPDVPWTPLLGLVAAGAAFLLVAEVATTLMHPPSQGDALSYHAPLGVLFWTDGDLTSPLDRSPEIWGLAHPGTAELLFGALRLVGGERLADLGQLPFAFLGSVAVYAFTRRTGLLRGAAALAACAFLLVPMVVLQVGTQANDLAGTALLMTALALASAPVAEWRADRVAMVGLALGLTSTTKLALLPSVAAVAVFVLAMIARGGGRTRSRLGWATVALFGLVFLAVVTPWWARNIAREGNPIFPQSIPGYGHGFDVGGGTHVDFDFVERRVAWPFYPVLEPIDDRSGFGALLAIAIIPGLLLALRRARRQPLVLYGASFAVTLVFWWAYSLHEPRFLLAYAGLALSLVPWALMAVPRRRRRLATGLVVLAGAFSIAVTCDQQIVPLARQPVERTAFYDRVYGVDSVAQSLPEDQSVLILTGYGYSPVDYASYYPLLGPSQERLVLLLDADSARGSTATVVARMQRDGVRYAYAQALPEFRRQVDQLFRRPEFRLVHESAIVPGERLGVRRTAYRPATPDEAPVAIRRYLFRLVSPGP